MPALTELKLYDDGSYLLDPSTFNPSGVTGPDKVASRFLYALLTPQGSVPGLPNAGSPFTQLMTGFNTDFDVHAAFLTALGSAAATVRTMEEASEPDSEKFGGARLDGIDVAFDAVTIHLTVVAQDGSLPTNPVSFDLPT